MVFIYLKLSILNRKNQIVKTVLKVKMYYYIIVSITFDSKDKVNDLFFATVTQIFDTTTLSSLGSKYLFMKQDLVFSKVFYLLIYL